MLLRFCATAIPMIYNMLSIVRFIILFCFHCAESANGRFRCCRVADRPFIHLHYYHSVYSVQFKFKSNYGRRTLRQPKQRHRETILFDTEPALFIMYFFLSASLSYTSFRFELLLSPHLFVTRSLISFLLFILFFSFENECAIANVKLSNICFTCVRGCHR